MACERRKRQGWCSHHLCEHSEECVDIIDGICEVGDTCDIKCEWRPKKKQEETAAEME